MTLTRAFAAFALLLGLAACAEEGRYPLTGEECGPEDPVTGMTAPDCPPAPVQ